MRLRGAGTIAADCAIMDTLQNDLGEVIGKSRSHVPNSLRCSKIALMKSGRMMAAQGLCQPAICPRDCLDILIQFVWLNDSRRRVSVRDAWSGWLKRRRPGKNGGLKPNLPMVAMKRMRTQ